MSKSFSALREDFKVYSAVHTGRLNKAVGPFFMPGFYVVEIYRLRTKLIRLGRPGKLISALIGLFASLLTGCYLNPKAKIAGGLNLPHPIGVVIGDGVTVGKNVRIYQNVTLGSRAVGTDAYPLVEDDVTLFPNSVITGHITIGRGAVVGAGSIVLKDVPPGAKAVGNPARILNPVT
jgi:serine O-acetyltransferase